MKPLKTDLKAIEALYKPIAKTTHKGAQGHALLVAGSYGKMGAAVLSAQACVRSGVGLVTVLAPECGCEILQISVPEAMVLSDRSSKYLSEIKVDFDPAAIGIGPGIGQERETAKALYQFLRKNSTPLVIDADALNILSGHPQWLGLLPDKCIMTPHLKELQRLIGTWEDEEEKFIKTVRFSLEHQCVLVMKGAPTFVTDGREVYENTTGNAALATGGTGDVLTGILTGLLAQGYEALEAARLGVFLHGLTADIAVPQTACQGFTATTVIAYLGRAFLSIDGGMRDGSGT